MIFSVLPDQKGTPHFSNQFALKRSNWDDFGYKISYLLYRKSDDDDSDSDLIGSLKILFPGGFDRNQMVIKEDFVALPPAALSVGTSLDFYERISTLAVDERELLMQSLNDVVANPDLRGEVANYDGYRKSFFRDVEDIEGFLEDADAILRSDFSQLPDLSAPFTFHVAGWRDSIKFSFDAPVDAWGDWGGERMGKNGPWVALPRRIAVIIGRNGCGKSTLLSRLARVAFAKPSDRKSDDFLALGQISPPEFGFTRVLSISYSAFDSFQIPGLDDSERLQIAKDIAEGKGRFIFCGLRDIASELQDEDGYALPDQPDRRPSTRLKDLNDLAKEFSSRLTLIQEKNRMAIFQDGLDVILADASFSGAEGESVAELIGDSAGEKFLSWSTGHKIAIHVLASITAHCQRKSIVLFDEPETHLHPPLIAALMRAVRIVLEQTNAFCIVATHSPVILQETLAQHVYIVERDGEIVTVRQPKMETFGESIGALTYDSFGLTAGATYFGKTLKRLVDHADESNNLDSLFPLGLSAQAEAFVMSLFARKEQESDG